MTDIRSCIDSILPSVCRLRHELHSEPELGFEEERTGDKVVEALRGVKGVSIRRGLGKTGILTTVGAQLPGPAIVLRAELDALPIQEENEIEHRSRVAGKMHACGHDGHIACLVGAIKILAAKSATLSRSVHCIFQPAEEGKGGARLLCEEGLLEELAPVAAMFTLHGKPELPLGTIALSEGIATASSDKLKLTVYGKGTHAATPHRGVDPILVASHIVTAIQSVVSRSISPLDSAVLSFGTISGGVLHTVIPECVKLTGTVRTTSPEVRELCLSRIRSLVSSIADGFGASAELEFEPGYPSVVNAPEAAQFARNAACDVVGEERVFYPARPELITEDFAYYAQRVPGALIHVGLSSGDPMHDFPLHSARFDFNDAAIPVFIEMLVRLATVAAE